MMARWTSGILELPAFIVSMLLVGLCLAVWALADVAFIPADARRGGLR